MTKTQQKRKDRLMPDGIPKYVRVYDNSGKTVDRYTVVYSRTGRSGSNRAKPLGRWNRHIFCSMSENPYHPQGVCSHDDSDSPIDYPSYGHLGKKIKFKDLPESCQRLVLEDYLSIWKVGI